jgi:hypothetical protein
LLGTVVVMALAAALAAFVGAFLKTKGEHFATKQDFNELQKQLRDNTQLVEAIKSEVSRRDWAQREWTTLRRTKLEALLEKMHECEEYLHRRRDWAIEGKPMAPERDCISEANALAVLYFPELTIEASNFRMSCRTIMSLIADLASEVIASRGDPAARQAAFDTFSSKRDPEYLKLYAAQSTFTTAARSLLERIMQIDDKSSLS